MVVFIIIFHVEWMSRSRVGNRQREKEHSTSLTVNVLNKNTFKSTKTIKCNNRIRKDIKGFLLRFLLRCVS